jgi:hypothetical protein
MIIGAYHFDGDPAVLTQAYDTFMAGYPTDELDLHVSVVREDGITILDSCPTVEAFEAFSRSPEFAAGLAAVGLPEPRVELLGDVHTARLRTPVAA